MNQDNSKWFKRLINYTTDNLIIILMFFLVLKVLPHVLSLIPFNFELGFEVILVFIYIAYYLIFESFTGMTPGKYITKTKIIRNDGRKPYFHQILIRTLIRLTFVEFISYFRERPWGWHDKASNTRVVDKNRTNTI